MKKLGSVTSKLMIAGFIACFGIFNAACSGGEDKAIIVKTEDQAHVDSAKAAAEAEAAEEAFAKSKTAHGAKTKRAVASVKTAKAKKSLVDPVYVVQVGTFRVEENAKNILAKLKTAGLPAFQKKIERENGSILYTVRVEPTPNRQEAEKFVASVKAATGESSLILSVER